LLSVVFFLRRLLLKSRLIRPWKRLNKVAFVSSLRSSILCADVTELSNYSTEELFDIYDNTIRRIVDTHVPAYSASIRDRRQLRGLTSNAVRLVADPECMNDVIAGH